MSRIYKLLPGILITFSIQQAYALNLQSYQFSNSYRYSLLEDSFKERFEGKFVGTLSYGYVHSPFYYSDRNLEDLREEIIKYNNVLTAGVSYYLNQNVSLGIDISGINNSVAGETYNTLGDTILKARVNLLRKENWSLSLNPKIILPTGKEDNFTTTDSVGGAISAVAEKSIKKLHFLASIGVSSARSNHFLEVDHRQLLLSQLGISYDISEKINLNFETYRNFPLVDDKLQDEGKYFLTGKHKTHKNFSSYIGAGVSAIDEVQRNTYSFFTGVKIHESPPVTSLIQSMASAPSRLEIPKFKEVFFEHDKYQLSQDDYEKINRVISFYNDNQNVRKIIIEGYASEIGTPKYNLKLSQRRAEAVKDYLVEQGLPEEKLETLGYGEEFDLHPDEAKNRKVDFRILQ